MQKLNNWMSILTNVGVLVGLVLVAYEVNQANKSLDIANRQWGTEYRMDRNEMLSSFLINIASDENLSSIWRRGNADEELDFEERHRYEMLVREWATKQFIHEQMQLDFDPTDEGSGRYVLAQYYIDHPGFKKTAAAIFKNNRNSRFSKSVREAEAELRSDMEVQNSD